MRTDLDHLPIAKQRELECVTRILFEEFEEGRACATSKRKKAGRNAPWKRIAVSSLAGPWRSASPPCTRTMHERRGRSIAAQGSLQAPPRPPWPFHGDQPCADWIRAKGDFALPWTPSIKEGRLFSLLD